MKISSKTRAEEIYQFLKYKDWTPTEALSALTYLGIQMAYSIGMPRKDAKRIYGSSVDLIYSANMKEEKS
jgi:hypothetical protein